MSVNFKTCAEYEADQEKLKSLIKEAVAAENYEAVFRWSVVLRKADIAVKNLQKATNAVNFALAQTEDEWRKEQELLRIMMD